MLTKSATLRVTSVRRCTRAVAASSPSIVGSGSGPFTRPHSSPTISGLALWAACLVFARRFMALRQWTWAAFCLATIAGDLAGAVVAGMTSDFRWLLAGGAVTWGWASVVAARLLADLIKE